MKHFLKRMAAFFAAGSSAPTGRPPASGVRERLSLSLSMWDEALAASMYDENARTLLDHWGSRWK